MKQKDVKAGKWAQYNHGVGETLGLVLKLCKLTGKEVAQSPPGHRVGNPAEGGACVLSLY